MARGAVLIIMFLGANALFGWKMLHLAMTLRSGKKMPVNVSLPRRVASVMKYYFGQARVIAEPAGIMHFFFFWGFWVLQLETIEYFVRAFDWHFHLSHIVGDAGYNGILFVQDVIGMALVVTVFAAIIRRFIIKPQHTTRSIDAAIILGLELSLILTKFVANGAEIALMPLDHLGHDPSWTPSAFAFSQLFGGPGSAVGSSAMWTLHNIGYWCHVSTVLFFLGYIPLGKHLHIIGAMMNVVFRKMEPKGALYLLDMDVEMEEDEEPKFGASELEDLNWKQLLDSYACTECARCQHYCPAYNSGKPLNPMMIVRKIKEHAKEKGEWNFKVSRAGEGAEVSAVAGEDYHTYSMAPEEGAFPNLLDNVITREELWSCTTCGACVANCPVFIEHVDTIVDMRRYLVLTESDVTPEVVRTFRNMENNSNPWGISASFRADWAEGLDIPKMSECEEPPEYLFFVGCAGSFDDRQKKVTKSLAKILKEANVSFAILGGEEKCTGDAARRLGNEYLYQICAQANIETLNKYHVTKIITTCPHCFHTIAKEYPQLGGEYEVLHHTELLADLIRTGRVQLKPTMAGQTITYHDSCYIGRWQGILDPPREIIDAIPGVQRGEMELNRNQSFCCGAGGGRMWMEEDLGQRINIARADQALETDPDVVAVACPFCLTMFNDGLKHRGAEEVKLLDLAEIVDANMVSTAAEKAE